MKPPKPLPPNNRSKKPPPPPPRRVRKPPEKPMQEHEKPVEKAKKKATRDETPEQEIMRPYSPEEILAFPTPTTQVEELFLPGALVMLVGPPKVGKTTLTADMVCAIQCGLPWEIGGKTLETEQGQIVYITNEGKIGWQARMRVLKMKYGNCKGFNDMRWFFNAPVLDSKEGRDFLLRSIDALDERPAIIVYRIPFEGPALLVRQ